jgi:multiple sugar transport system substrate-binding protein
MPRFFDAGLLLDVSEVFAASDALAGGLFPAAKEVATMGDMIVGVPASGSVTPAYWRTDKLAEAGLSEPPKTYAEMKDFCEKVNTDEFYCYGFAFGGYSDNEVQMANIIWSYGGQLTDETGKNITINSPETLAALQWIKEMADIGSFPSDAIVGDDMSNNLWYQTRAVASVVNTGSILAWMINNDEELLGMSVLTPSPGGPAGTHAGGGFGGVLGAFNTTKYPDLAKSFIQWMTHPDRVWARSEAVKFGNLPVHLDAAKDPVWEDPHLKPFIDQLEFAHPRCWPGPATSACVIVQGELVLSRMAQRVVDGSQTPEESLAQAEQEMIKIYEDNPPK